LTKYGLCTASHIAAAAPLRRGGRGDAAAAAAAAAVRRKPAPSRVQRDKGAGGLALAPRKTMPSLLAAGRRGERGDQAA
jgi:hypothetical protein